MLSSWYSKTKLCNIVFQAHFIQIKAILFRFFDPQILSELPTVTGAFGMVTPSRASIKLPGEFHFGYQEAQLLITFATNKFNACSPRFQEFFTFFPKLQDLCKEKRILTEDCFYSMPSISPETFTPLLKEIIWELQLHDEHCIFFLCDQMTIIPLTTVY